MAALGALFSPRTPVRGIAVYMWATVALNAAAWLARIVPAVVRGGPPGYLRGTGLTTNVVYVQDLALWLPLLAVAAAWLWRRRPRGYLLSGAGLTLAAPRPPAAARRGWPPWILATLDGLTGAVAVYGGAELIRDGFGMPDSWLAGTPLTGWVLPGFALLIGVAGPQLAAAVLIGGGARLALAAGYLAGLLLIAWIAVELLVLRRYFFLQPVIAVSASPRCYSPGDGSGPPGTGLTSDPGGSSPGTGTYAPDQVDARARD